MSSRYISKVNFPKLKQQIYVTGFNSTTPYMVFNGNHGVYKNYTAAFRLIANMFPIRGTFYCEGCQCWMHTSHLWNSECHIL